VLAARKFLRNLKVWTWDFQRKITSDGEWAPCVFLALARKNSSSVFFFFPSQLLILGKYSSADERRFFLVFSVFVNYWFWEGLSQFLFLDADLFLPWKRSMHGAGGISSRRMAFFAVLCTEFWVIDRFLIYILLIENVINCYGRC